MKRAAIQIAVLAVVLLAICAACRLAVRNTYTAYIPVAPGVGEADAARLSVEEETPGVVDFGAPERHDGYLRMKIRPEHPGETFLNINSDRGENLAVLRFKVSPLGTVYDESTGGYTGDTVTLAASTVFWLIVAVIMLGCYRRAKGPAFYSYDTVHSAGFSLFALLTGLLTLVVTVRHLLRPHEFSMLSVYSAICGAGFNFVGTTAPFMILFALAMSVSNVALIRHEGFKPKNALGIGVSLALLLGVALAFFLYTRDFAGSEWEWRVSSTLQNVYAAAFSYFECMLIGAIVCGLRAAKHVPDMGADYILILGCKFRRDGTLTPLLRGRVDRAIDFWRAQERATGKRATLMPSGGQGADEPISEAEAMERYLLSQGVPGSAIRLEDQSRNTYQNMEKSRALIEAERPGAKVVYATTNYHVFRSGVWAAKAGLPAEGMGSPTKWWYWPNAFMRECAGLLMNRIPQELALLAVTAVFFGAMSMVLG